MFIPIKLKMKILLESLTERKHFNNWDIVVPDVTMSSAIRIFTFSIDLNECLSFSYLDI